MGPRPIDLAVRLLTALLGAYLLWFAALAFGGQPAPFIHGQEGIGTTYPIWTSRAEAIGVGIVTSVGGVICLYTALRRMID